MASSRLVFEFAREDENLQAALPSLLQTILILFDEQSREVIKSAVGFVRVCVAAMQPEELQPLLPDVVGSILKYHKGKDRFRAKIKIILKKLVKMYGYDTLMPLVPESESRLLTHMRKLEERAARRKAANREDGAQGPQNYDDMVGSDEYDSDEGKTLMTGATGLTRKTAKTQLSGKSEAQSLTSKTRASASSVRSRAATTNTIRLPSENDGEVVNILNLSQKNARFAGDDSDDSDSDGIMEFDDRGRLVVNDDDAMEDDVLDMSDAVNASMNTGSNKRRRLQDKGNESESVKSGEKKRQNDRKVRDLGASYKSKKAGGDVKKKGQKFEPYAYVPLDGRSYSKKNRRRAVEQMATVVPQGGKRKRK
jgi:ribosomal RNA-processing protein 12